MKAKLLILLLLIPVLGLPAQGYKIVHPDGTVEFSDQPAKDAEEIALPQAQGYESKGSSTAPDQGVPPPLSQKQNDVGYLQFAITSPKSEEMIPNTGGVVGVAVSVSPALKQGDQVVVTMDGGEVARGGATSFTLTEVERGAHQLSASIVDSSGTVVRQADAVTFYVSQPSLLNPYRRK